jgi:hypothetical protein
MTEDGAHVVTEEVKGGIAEQQGVRVGRQLVGSEGKSSDEKSQDRGVDLPGAYAAAAGRRWQTRAASSAKNRQNKR